MSASLVKYAFFFLFDIFCFFIKDEVFEDVWIDIRVSYSVPLVLLSVLMTIPNSPLSYRGLQPWPAGHSRTFPWLLSVQPTQQPHSGHLKSLSLVHFIVVVLYFFFLCETESHYAALTTQNLICSSG